MAIAYKSQGAGVGTETSGAALQPACPATVDANDILVAHVVYLDNATAPSTPSGWELLFGPSGLGTGTPTGRAWAFGKIAAGTEDGAAISFGTQGGTVGRLARIYSFSGYVSGSITDVIPAASFAANSSETDPVIQAVTTTVAGAKAVALVSQDDDNTHAGLGAVTGGTWAEAVADYVNTTVGPQGAKLQIQVGTPTSDPGTISGGTVAGTNDECNTICFEIRPNAPVVETTGTGALAAQASSVSGVGVSGSTGTGALSAQAATVDGAGTSSSTGTGALAAQAAALAGAGVSGSTGTGTLSAQAATIAGEGEVSGEATISGSGDLVASGATISGAGTTISIGLGVLIAQAAAVQGAGASASGGAGVLLVGPASVSGAGVSGSTGSGELVSQSATISGSDEAPPAHTYMNPRHGVTTVGRMMS